MQVSNRQRKADEEYVKGFFLLSRDLREDILKGRFRVRKTDIKKLGKIEGIKDGSIESIDQIQSMINATPKSGSEKKIHPMLFSKEMVRALLDGRKTQTRRVVTPNSPKVKTGDIIWVREPYREVEKRIEDKANEPFNVMALFEKINPSDRWKPSLFMQKSLCRLFLEITDVRLEHLNDISEEDAIAEGVRYEYDPAEPDKKLFWFYAHGDLRDDTLLGNPKTSFYSLWLMINGKGSWQKNPLVWVYSFKIIERPKNFPKKIVLEKDRQS
jgi:hypothetical protein